MRELIENIANMLGMDLRNPYTLSDISQVKNLEGFKPFIEENFNDSRLKFLNPSKTFLMLRKMYYEEINRERIEKSQKASFELGDKFRSLKPRFREIQDKEVMTRYLSQNIDGDMVRCFTDFENTALGKVGNLKRLLYLDDNHQLEEELDKVFQSVVYDGASSLKIAQKQTNDTLDNQMLISAVKTALNQF